ncbi:TPA: PIN domain-containing protein [Legionella pneumophila]|nr:hypothetical protein [Legionella pneumophila]
MPRGKIIPSKENTLLFIDTNIFLDFYRVRDSVYEKKWLGYIASYSEILLMTEQVYMEFLKNRQSVINESFNQINKILEEEKKLVIPAFLAEKPSAKNMKKWIERCKKHISKLKDEYLQALDDSKKDDVFVSIKKIVCNLDPKFFLSRDMENPGLRFQIRDSAERRFKMGYPPKKSKDISFVDAINWEWIVYCAKEYSKHIVIISRDGDYGLSLKPKDNGEIILNDWLKKEFQERVSSKKRIIVFNKLSSAFKYLGLSITPEDVQVEEDIIKDSLPL